MPLICHCCKQPCDPCRQSPPLSLPLLLPQAPVASLPLLLPATSLLSPGRVPLQSLPASLPLLLPATSLLSPGRVPLQSLPASLLLLLPATSLLSPAGVPLQSLPESGCCLYSKFHCCHSWKPRRYPCRNSNCYLNRKTNLVK